MGSISSLEEMAVGVLDGVMTYFSEVGRPLNIAYRTPHKWRKTSGHGESRKLIQFPLLSPGFRYLVAELRSKAIEKERDPVSWFNYIEAPVQLLPIGRHGNDDIEGFVLADIHDLAGARFWPVDFPSDVVTFLFTGFGPAADRVRVLGELTGFYRDVIRFAGEDIRILARIEASLCELATGLGVALRQYRDQQSRGADNETAVGDE